MRSVECNVMEDDSGSFWGVAGAVADIEIGEEKLPYAEDPKHAYPVYKRGGKKITTGKGVGDGIRPGPIADKPYGEWNTCEVIAVGGTGIHVVNGKVNMVITNSRYKQGDAWVPLAKGKIQLQSEFAEVYFRNVRIKPLKEIPENYREWVPK
jgi:hypothetical protein